MPHPAAVLALAPSADGSTLFTADAQGNIHRWPLPTVIESTGPLRDLAELLTAHRLDAHTGFTPLSYEEVAERMQKTRSHRPER